MVIQMETVHRAHQRQPIQHRRLPNYKTKRLSPKCVCTGHKKKKQLIGRQVRVASREMPIQSLNLLLFLTLFLS